MNLVYSQQGGAVGARADKVAWLLARLERLPDEMLDSVVVLVCRTTGEDVAVGLEIGPASQTTDKQG